jgi:predicted DNA-binding protein (MmcQ/YjbR family)
MTSRDEMMAACLDPDLALGLRARYAAITAGYHLNKRHWNTVELDGSVPGEGRQPRKRVACRRRLTR